MTGQVRQVTVDVDDLQFVLDGLQRADEALSQWGALFERRRLDGGVAGMRNVAIPIRGAKLWIAALITQPTTERESA